MRTRSTGVISFSTVRIGFTFSVDPIHALAAPMRPPRLRNSSVSMANQRRSSLRAAATWSATSFALPPSRAAFAAASTMKPRPPAAVVESTTSIRSPPLPSRVSASFAWRAASGVPDSPPEMWTETTSPPSASSGSNTSVKSPTGRLRGGRQLLRRAQLLEERRVVGDVDLGDRAVAAEHHVQRDDGDAVPLDQVRRQVRGAVGHHRDGGHARGSL